jgi:hypothetical protein
MTSCSEDWEAVLRGHVALAPPVLELCALLPGDRLEVQTRHTCYRLVWAGNDWAQLTTDRPDRPDGRIRIQGCAFGAGTTIAPGRLFTGGSLEFLSQGGALTHRTTPIVALRLWQRRVPG